MTLAFAILARLLRGVNTSGAVTGAGIAFAIYLGTGQAGFFTLVCLFVLTWLGTRIGYQRKRRLGLAEFSQGRSAAQVAANLTVAAAFSLAAIFLPGRDTLLVAMVAALAEAAADTVSSECGEALSPHAYLITTFERLPPGTDGGISVLGSLCGVAAGLMTASVAAVFGLITPPAILTTTLAAVLGMFLDSVLGATLERRGLLNNHSVNFVSTASAAGVALVLVQV